jgi:hypothetical protein
MKVVQILPELNAGGVEGHVLELAGFLASQGHESIVISNGGNMVAKLEPGGVRHVTMPVHRKSLRSLFQVRKLRAWVCAILLLKQLLRTQTSPVHILMKIR